MKRLPVLASLGVVLLGVGGANLNVTGSEPPWAADEIIDVHGHVGSFRGYDLSTPTLMDNIERFGVRLVLVSNIDGAHLPGTTLDLDETSANEAALQAVRQHPERLRGLAWARPAQGGSPEAIEPFLRDFGFVGVKLHPDMNQFPADAEAVDPYLALCEKYGVPAVFHSGAPGSNSGPERIYAAARRHSGVPVVLYHMTFLGDHDASIQAVAQALQAKDAELFLETAQAEPAAVLRAVRTVGADRVLFGTDATYYGKAHYERYVPMIQLLREELSPEEFRKVTRDNARRLFRLK
jgi:hypothetical protein